MIIKNKCDTFIFSNHTKKSILKLNMYDKFSKLNSEQKQHPYLIPALKWLYLL